MRNHFISAVAIVVFGWIHFGAMSARADNVTQEELDRADETFCTGTINEIRNCCVLGQCDQPSKSRSKKGALDFALAINPEELRGLRSACNVWRGEPATSCPDGRHLAVKSFLFTNLDAKSAEEMPVKKILDVKTQGSIYFYSALDATPPKTKNDAVIQALSEHQRLCTMVINDLAIGQVQSRFARECFAKRKVEVESLRVEAETAISSRKTDPQMRREIDGKPVDPYLRDFKTRTCDVAIDGNGYFASPYISDAPLFADTPGSVEKHVMRKGTAEEEAKAAMDEFKTSKKIIDQVIEDDWRGDLSEKDRKKLLTNECVIRDKDSSVVRDPSQKLDGQIHIGILNEAERAKVRPAVKTLREMQKQQSNQNAQ